MGMVDILWKALEEYRERHEYQWKQSLITTAVENGTEVIMENEVVVESEAQETDGRESPSSWSIFAIFSSIVPSSY